MPVPTNLSAATATDVGTLPAAIVQTVDDSGTTYTVWYKYVGQAGDVVLGVFAYGDAAVYQPTIRCWTGDAGAPTEWIAGNQIFATNKPIQLPIVDGETYYFEIIPNGGDPTPAVLTLAVERAPQDPIQNGSIVVNDDSHGFPAVVLSHLTNYTARRFVYPFPAGEAGDVLADGTMLWYDATADTLESYTNAFVPINSLALVGEAIIRTCQGTQRFFVGTRTNPVIVHLVEADGTFGANWTLTGISSLFALAASNDEAVLYHAPSTSGAAVARWDLIGDAPLSDFVAGVSGYFVRDLLVLQDDTIVISYGSLNTGDFFVRRYSAAGSLLNEYPFGTVLTPFFTLARLAYAIADPVSFWVWTHLTGDEEGISRFQEIRAADGVPLTVVDHAEYELGAYLPAESATPLGRFGNSFSCPFLIARVPGFGRLIVQKALLAGVAAQAFPIAVGGGLSPDILSLADGDSHVYDPVPEGSGYSVAEPSLPSGYTLVGITVSNESPADNISVVDGETVTVTVVNTPAATPATPVSPCQVTECAPQRGGPRQGV